MLPLMLDMLDQRIDELARAQRLQACFNAWMRATLLSLFVAALLVMLLRLAWSASGWLELPLFCLAGLTPLLLLPRHWRQRRSHAQLAAEIDLLAHGQGLCMALATMPSSQRDPDWMARLRRNLDELRLPHFQWHAAKFLPLVLACVLLALLMPRAHQQNTESTRYGAFFDDLSMALNQLAADDLINQDIIEEKQQEIKQLKARAQEVGMNQELWLARDKLKSYLDQQRQHSQQRLADTIMAAQQLSAEQNTENQQQLMQALANLAADNKDLLQKIAQQDGQQIAELLQHLNQDAQLTAEQRAALQQFLQRNNIDPQQWQKSDEKIGMNSEQQQQFAKGLLAKLNQHSAEMPTIAALVADMQQNGNGAVSRGPGHVALTEQTPHPLKSGAIQSLMPGAHLNADGSITIAETVRDAEIDDAALQAAVRAAAKQFDPSAADARRSQTAPRHRATVARYFTQSKSIDADAHTSAPKAIPRTIPKNTTKTNTETNAKTNTETNTETTPLFETDIP